MKDYVYNLKVSQTIIKQKVCGQLNCSEIVINNFYEFIFF